MNDIFKHFVEHSESDESKRMSYTYWFLETFPEAEFIGDELLFHKFLSFCSDLESPVKFKYLESFISTELRSILIHNNIHVKGTESLNYDDPSALESAVRITGTVLRDNYKVLESMDEDLNDFVIDMSSYMTEKRGQRLTDVLSSTYDIIQTKDDSDYALKYVSEQSSLLQDIYSPDNLEELASRSTHTSQPYKVCSWGIEAIDRDSEGIWTKQLVGIEAQPGTGKTRLALGQVLYNAAINGKNCLFVSLEQNVEELEAMLLAKHVYLLFDVQLSDKMIIRDTVPDDYKSMVEAARIDLFESEKYGKISLVETDFYVETFINKIKNMDKLKGPFDLIVIDYMGLIESKGENYRKQKVKYEVISDSFKYFKRYLRHSNKAGVAISQFNREGIEAGKAGKTITTDMAEGGISVYRHTDYNIAMSMTETMKAHMNRQLSQPKVRSSQGFGNIILDVRLGFCYFKQKTMKEV